MRDIDTVKKEYKAAIREVAVAALLKKNCEIEARALSYELQDMMPRESFVALMEAIKTELQH